MGIHAGATRITEFLDPGECLLHYFRELKRSQPGASHRYIAAAIGMKSSASFALLIRGRIHPAPRVIDALAQVFGLDPGERDHLALLFELRRVRDPSARFILRNLIILRTRRPDEDAIADPGDAPMGGAITRQGRHIGSPRAATS